MPELLKNIEVKIEMILAPLEQFKVLSLYSLILLNLDLSLTNALVLALLLSILFFSFSVVLKKHNVQLKSFNCYYFFPTAGQSFVEFLNKFISELVKSSLNKRGELFYPFISSLFVLVLFCNLIGLIPYSFTLTSHLIITFLLSFSVFIGVNIVGFEKHSLAMASLIIPANTSVVLAVVLVPIEFVSYVVKPVSLGVRLFINLMAGHTLLKVIFGFSWGLALMDNFLFFSLHLVPLFLLILLMGLELGVALIQAYVFTILICIYLNDSINLH
jgi:F-type H+-transporting ATPase subunit a